MRHPGTRCYRPAAWVLLLFIALAGCDANDEAARCEIFQTCDVTATLNVALIEHQTRPPANVSLLFKVDTEDGAPVPGLQPANFDIFENEQLVSRFESRQSIVPKARQFRFTVALLLDLSGSIVASESLEPLKAAARSFVEATLFARDDPRYGEIEMGIWWFDGQAELVPLVGVTSDPDLLLAGIEDITADLPKDNSTNLYGAVVQGIDQIDQRLEVLVREQIIAAGTVVLFTDGTDQASRVPRSEAMTAVRRAGPDVSIYAIGLGGEIDEATLTEIGRDGFVAASRIDDLLPRFQEIAGFIRDEANSYYLLEYCSPKRSGEHELTVRVTDGTAVGLLATRFEANEFTAGCTVSQVLAKVGGGR
ncbi:MAG: hypothetical protein KatS3mg043_2040 [Rhodothermaceae bacterium]|nr:MAG: hypothetical protein KatS3mg042_1474 [Rhodothermaceae bacterium]GIV60951.1 MAG: hypothetical protein KatS3mg043_2040 [Rhodothermaceae bacterium]